MTLLSREVLAALAETAIAAWELPNPRLNLVSISENTVFRACDSDDREYVLRIHRLGYHTFDELVSEHIWTRALRDAGIEAPEAIPTARGDEYATVPVPGTGEIRHVGLATWAPGTALQRLVGSNGGNSAPPEHYESLGRLMALLHDHATHWNPPPQFTRHKLDADGLMGESPFWGCFWTHPQLSNEQSRLFSSSRQRLHDLLTAYGTSRDRYSLIHADLHFDNVLLYGDNLSIIDFDDAGWGWHAYDIAVAFFWRAAAGERGDAFEHFCTGYRQVRSLSEEVIRMIDVFTTVRALASIGWRGQRPEHDHPETTNHLINVASERCESLLSESSR